MNSIAPELPRRTSSSRWPLNLDPWALTIWLIAVVITVFFALVDSDATIIGGAYFPRGNDSFYHARRILDAAIGARGFYQFDDRLHVPDGAWIPWPWAYDYLMAKALQLALWLNPTLDPVAFISYVPVAFITVNAALFLAATGTLGLSREMRLLAMLCFALSPLMQLLHVIGMVDHHYVEHTFVLLGVWLGLRWFARPENTWRAAQLALALGFAPAFHSGLFILQLVPLGALFLLWLRNSTPSAAALRTFAIVLPASALLAALPSEALRRGMFEFGLLSWFHVYVAVCTATAVAFMARRSFSRLNVGFFLLLCAALAAPLGAQLVSGAGFLSGKFSILEHIVEVQSPYRLFTEIFGARETLSFYSSLLFVAPALLAFYAYKSLVSRQPQQLYFAVFVVFGLALLLDQFRFHYFGFFALIAGTLLIVDTLRERFRWHRGAIFTGTLAAIFVAYQPALRDRLFVVYAPGADSEYASAMSIFLRLRDVCANTPGTVLASPDDGSAILFHSECSVIANNFILRPEDEQHIGEVKRLMLLSPARLREERPDVKYIFVRVRDFSVLEGDVAYIVENNEIAKALLVDPLPPEGYTLIATVRRRIGADGVAGVYARLYGISPLAGATTSGTAPGAAPPLANN
jgi:hypothetical protein